MQLWQELSGLISNCNDLGGGRLSARATSLKLNNMTSLAERGWGGGRWTSDVPNNQDHNHH